MSEPSYGPTGAGSVVLDVGGQVGALVLHTPPALAGAEIEISPRGAGGRRTHASVRERHVPGGTRYAAVYPGLAAGVYTVWAPDGSPAASVTITGGRITHHDLDHRSVSWG
jgi:hypothetical protein